MKNPEEFIEAFLDSPQRGLMSVDRYAPTTGIAYIPESNDSASGLVLPDFVDALGGTRDVSSLREALQRAKDIVPFTQEMVDILGLPITLKFDGRYSDLSQVDIFIQTRKRYPWDFHIDRATVKQTCRASRIFSLVTGISYPTIPVAVFQATIMPPDD